MRKDYAVDNENGVWCLQDVLRVILMRHIERNKPLMRCNKFGKKVLDKLNL